MTRRDAEEGNQLEVHEVTPPSSPTSSAGSSDIFWELHDRIANTERKTTELTSLSERQMGLIERTKAEQQRLTAGLLARIQQNTQNVGQLQNLVRTLATNQDRTNENFAKLQVEVEEIKKQLAAKELQDQRRASLRNASQAQQQREQQQQHFSRNHGEDSMLGQPEPGPVFTDAYGRSKSFRFSCKTLK